MKLLKSLFVVSSSAHAMRPGRNDDAPICGAGVGRVARDLLWRGAAVPLAETVVATIENVRRRRERRQERMVAEYRRTTRPWADLAENGDDLTLAQQLETTDVASTLAAVSGQAMFGSNTHDGCSLVGTPLIIAVYNQHWEAAGAILAFYRKHATGEQLRGMVNSRDDEGKSALWYAVLGAHVGFRGYGILDGMNPGGLLRDIPECYRRDRFLDEDKKEKQKHRFDLIKQLVSIVPQRERADTLQRFAQLQQTTLNNTRDAFHSRPTVFYAKVLAVLRGHGATTELGDKWWQYDETTPEE